MKARRIVLFLIMVSTVALAQSNPVPLINNPLVPDAVAPGGPSFTLTVNGTGFVSASTVNWNGTPLATTYVSGSQLAATVPASYTIESGTRSVTVVNPSPGGGTSNVEFLGVRQSFSGIGLGQVNLATGEGPYGPVTADLNGDGDLDIVVITGNGQSTSALSVLLGNGNGSFQQQVSYSVPALAVQVAVGDFNNDGKIDLAATGGTGFSILFGNGDGTFQPYQEYGLSTSAYTLAAADVNADGNLDLILVTNVPSSMISVVLGNGNGTFQAPITYLLSTNAGDAGFIAIGDFNNDSRLDVATALKDEAAVAVLLGNGDGTLQNPVDYAAGISPVVVETADFNGDGRLDFVTVTYGAASILLGKGDGSFPTAVVYDIVPPTVGVTIGDFEGNGTLDFAVNSQDGVSVYLGNGDGTFPSSQYFYSGFNDAIVSGDFNGDGKLDFAVVEGVSSQVAILVQSDLLFSENVANFGKIRVGKTATQEVSITNLGTGSVRIGGFSITESTYFGESNNCPQTLSSGANCTLTLTFTPSTSGFFKALVNMTDSSVKGPQRLLLEGRAM